MKPRALAFRLARGSQLAAELSVAEQIYKLYTNTNPVAGERISAVMALDSIIDHFSDCELELNPLLRLRDALVSAEPVAMLRPPRGLGRGRQGDRPRKHEAKGMLAAMVRLRQDIGDDRRKAASWVAGKCPQALRKKLAPKAKSLTADTVLGWLDWYGGDGGQAGPGRETFLLVRSLSPLMQAAAKAGDRRRIDRYLLRLMHRFEPTLASK
jgi:hypothetical protein